MSFNQEDIVNSINVFELPDPNDYVDADGTFDSDEFVAALFMYEFVRPLLRDRLQPLPQLLVMPSSSLSSLSQSQTKKRKRVSADSRASEK